MFPKDMNIFDQYHTGSNLVEPITEAGVTTHLSMLLKTMYYDYFTHRIHRGAAAGKSGTISAALHQVPLLVVEAPTPQCTNAQGERLP